MSAVRVPPVGRATLDRLERLAALFETETDVLVRADASFDAAVTAAALALIDGGDTHALLEAVERVETSLSLAETRARRIGLLVGRLVARIAATMPPAGRSGRPA